MTIFLISIAMAPNEFEECVSLLLSNRRAIIIVRQYCRHDITVRNIFSSQDRSFSFGAVRFVTDWAISRLSPFQCFTTPKKLINEVSLRKVKRRSHIDRNDDLTYILHLFSKTACNCFVAQKLLVSNTNSSVSC